MININGKEIDASFDVERELQCCVIGDGINYTGSVINKEGVILQSNEFGFGYEGGVPTAKEYLNWFIHNGHRNIYQSLNLKLN